MLLKENKCKMVARPVYLVIIFDDVHLKIYFCHISRASVNWNKFVFLVLEALLLKNDSLKLRFENILGQQGHSTFVASLMVSSPAVCSW